MNYLIEKYRTRALWLKARGIGGSDLAAIVNKVGRWANFIEVYDRLKGKPEPERDTVSMSRGRKAEEPVKELFLLSHPELSRVSPKRSIWLIRRKDLREITLSPDTLLRDRKGRKCFAEIKLKQVFGEAQIPTYLQSLREEEPQYWWQCMHYFVAMDDCAAGYLVVCFEVMEKDEKGKWRHSRFVIDELRIPREAVAEDIALAEETLKAFILENLRPGIRPKTTIQSERSEKKIEWTKSSSIRTLKP